MAKLRIVAEEANISMTATLNDSETAKKLFKLLPIESRAQTWGEEVYFETPLKAPEQDPHAEVSSGAIAYWPPGHAFCIFFGQEPYSPVNVLGALDGDAKLFARVKSGDKIRLEHFEEGKPKSKQPRAPHVAL
jgi:hypothetical protein